jgi:hypothetical protein
MLPTVGSEESKEALNRRLESLGWGLFLIAIGMLWLAPAGVVPEGTWLIAAGVILLGVNLVRYRNDITLSGTGVLLGLLAIIFGVASFVGLELPFVAILLIVVGASIILRPWIDPLLQRKRT